MDHEFRTANRSHSANSKISASGDPSSLIQPPSELPMSGNRCAQALIEVSRTECSGKWFRLEV